MELKDGATRIFLNTHGQNPEEVPGELVEFLNYMENTPEGVSRYESPRVKELAHQIDRNKQNQEVGVKYMQLWEEMEYKRLEGKEEVYPDLTDDELAELLCEKSSETAE